MRFRTLAWVLLLLLLGGAALAAEDPIVAEGKKLAFDRGKGNCLACHAIEGGDNPGNVGPPLVGMKYRFDSKQALWDKLWDPTQRDPDTIMPPFGRNYILSEDEFYKLVEYVWQL